MKTPELSCYTCGYKSTCMCDFVKAATEGKIICFKCKKIVENLRKKRMKEITGSSSNGRTAGSGPVN